MTGIRLNLLMFVLFVILILLQYKLWFEPGGIRDMLQLKNNLNAKIAENQQLKKRNEVLLFQIQRLQHSPDATEARARNELGMLRKDETFYQIVR